MASKYSALIENLLSRAIVAAKLVKLDENGNAIITDSDRKKIAEAGADIIHKLVVLKSREKLDEIEADEAVLLGSDTEDDAGAEHLAGGMDDDGPETYGLEGEHEEDEFGAGEQLAQDRDEIRGEEKGLRADRLFDSKDEEDEFGDIKDLIGGDDATGGEHQEDGDDVDAFLKSLETDDGAEAGEHQEDGDEDFDFDFDKDAEDEDDDKGDEDDAEDEDDDKGDEDDAEDEDEDDDKEEDKS